MLTHNMQNRVIPDSQTQSFCPKCLRLISANIRDSENGLFMEKYCPEHGPFRVLVSNNLETYQRIRQTRRKITKPVALNTSHSKGCPNDCGLCTEHEQHTCLAILEITSRCDLSCPICLNSSLSKGNDLKIEKIEAALKKLILCEGGVTPLQLSGGEPTLHPELVKIIKLTHSLGFSKTEINTNGLSLGRNPFLAKELKAAGLSGVYLQMDSLDPKVNKLIRGKDFVDEKLKAIENCTRAGIQVVLSVTVVPHINDESLWEMIEFAIQHHLTGVNFQSIALSGRFPKALSNTPDRMTLSHFMHAIERQSNGKLMAGDISPIPCPDPRCGSITYALISGKELIPLNRIMKKKALQRQMADICDWETLILETNQKEDLLCSSQNDDKKIPGCFADLLIDASHFSIGFHGMMDVFNFDIERVKRCCVHALDSDGQLIPFCLYNIKRGFVPSKDI